MPSTPAHDGIEPSITHACVHESPSSSLDSTSPFPSSPSASSSSADPVSHTNASIEPMPPITSISLTPPPPPPPPPPLTRSNSFSSSTSSSSSLGQTDEVSNLGLASHIINGTTVNHYALDWSSEDGGVLTLPQSHRYHHHHRAEEHAINPRHHRHRYQYGDNTPHAASPLDPSADLLCPFQILDCAFVFSDIVSFKMHVFSHFRGHSLPVFAPCFLCDHCYSQTDEDDPAWAWNNMLAHMVYEHYRLELEEGEQEQEDTCEEAGEGNEQGGRLEQDERPHSQARTVLSSQSPSDLASSSGPELTLEPGLQEARQRLSPPLLLSPTPSSLPSPSPLAWITFKTDFMLMKYMYSKRIVSEQQFKRVQLRPLPTLLPRFRPHVEIGVTCGVERSDRHNDVPNLSVPLSSSARGHEPTSSTSAEQDQDQENQEHNPTASVLMGLQSAPVVTVAGRRAERRMRNDNLLYRPRPRP